jgi:hypothetical protein
LKYNVEHLIDGEQARLKRPLQREEKMQIMRREIDNKVLTSSWWGLSSTAKPAMLLPAADLKDAWVTVGGKKIMLGSIPATDRAEIIAARQKRGLPISEQSIAETWVRAGSPTGGPSGQNTGWAPIEPGPYDKDVQYAKNSGMAFLSAIPTTNAAVFGLAQAVAEGLSNYVTGPLNRMRVLPEDVFGRMAQKLKDWRHNSEAVRNQWFPKPADFKMFLKQIPPSARTAIEATLKAHNVPVTDESVAFTYKAYLDSVREAQGGEAPAAGGATGDY